jgi:hypothetical protein
MADFDELRGKLAEARAAVAAADDDLARALDAARRAEAALARHEREPRPDDEEYEAEHGRLVRQREAAARNVGVARDSRAQAHELAEGALEAFALLSDPREEIGRLSDAYPILLFPVRLETRFKEVPGDEGAVRSELWVRIYPDTCLIDTFEATLSDVEVRNARAYWQGIWRAGGFEEDERAAWRNLVASHGSGRATWIVGQYRPVNEAPTKAAREDVVLVIPTETPLQQDERSSVETYWRAFWLADGNAAGEENALTSLRNDVGAARADELVAAYRPVNLEEEPGGGVARDAATVAVAFVVFQADVETKLESWTHAPKVNILPDRFVLIASSGSESTVLLGEAVHSPLIVGPDPSAAPEDQLRADNGDLVVPDEMRWLVDFERAVEWGMGFKVELTDEQAASGFDRLLVLGVRMAANDAAGKAELEELLDHHKFGRSGFSLVRQGTPTNNTEAAGSGFTRSDDADESFDDLAGDALFTPTSDELRKSDGQRLAELLGIDAARLEHVRNADGVDHSEARAMQLALWPATLGYFMETMMRPAFDDAAVESTRQFFTAYVSGRGVLPAVRIGAQPYGILPTTAFSRIDWIRGEGGPVTAAGGAAGAPFLKRLYDLLMFVDADWNELARGVSYVGERGDAHRLLLDILGLHPASAEFHYRYARSYLHLFNHLNVLGVGQEFVSAAEPLVDRALELLRRLGYTGEPPDIVERYFHRGQGALRGPVVVDGPLSETDALGPSTDDDENYLRWLVDSARASLDALRVQDGFKDDKVPTALLYLLLRHALILGYDDAGYLLHRAILPEAELLEYKREPPFVHVAEREASESRWASLYKADERITDHPTRMVAEHIALFLDDGAAMQRLKEQIDALEVLVDTPTARLERLLAEHVDCASYRFDAWLLGLVHLQLEAMRARTQDRNGNGDGDGRPRGGVYLGAYAWLEDVRPEGKELTPVELPEDLDAIFNREGDPPLLRDPTNGGYIHAPSLNHAVTAAVLRNAYIANASPSNPGSLAVNLSSERVRLALSLLEGIRAGQSLGALLGYRLERGLHDRHGLAEVDRFVFSLRKAFPLRADRLASTKTDDDVAIEAIEARNVVDGLRLIEHIKKEGDAHYPFDLDLEDANAAESAAIDAEVDRLLDVHDAVADLALAEGVHQAVQGNYDRVAGTLDAYTTGHYPPDPDVIRTPRSGVGLTHRVGLHLEPGLAAPAGATPRATAEPGLDRWLAGVLPPLDRVSCKVVWPDPVTGSDQEADVTLDQLGLRPIDLVFLVRAPRDQAMSELDDRVIRHVIANSTPRPDAVLEIRYVERPPGAGAVSIFELGALVAPLRSLVLRARPLRASDVSLHNEATQRTDELVVVRRPRVAQVKSDLDGLTPDLADYLDDLDPLLADLPARRNDVLDGIDDFLDGGVSLLERAARFGIPETGWGFAYAWRRAQYTALVTALRERASVWSGRMTEYTALVDEYDLNVGTSPDDELLSLLLRAERKITTAPTPLPAAHAAVRLALPAKEASFAARRQDMIDLADGSIGSLNELLSEVRDLQIAPFDAEPLPIADAEERILSFAAELAGRMRALAAEVERRSDAAQTQLAAHDAAGSAAARVEALTEAITVLLGEDFPTIPEFDVSDEQGDEWQAAFAASAGLRAYLTDDLDVDEPVDEWLYGAARVRENMRAWERIVLLAGGFGRTEPELTPIQLPHRPDDRWLALEFPSGYDLVGDRLLYTAHYPVDFDKSQRQCGLLLDEWTEVIPGTEETTGIGFHYDRPNSEAPQSLLLVTPARWDGTWQWDDLVGALDETLELAKKRAVEPVHLDDTAYATFLPATITAAMMHGISIALTLATNNQVFELVEERPDV